MANSRPERHRVGTLWTRLSSGHCCDIMVLYLTYLTGGRFHAFTSLVQISDFSTCYSRAALGLIALHAQTICDHWVRRLVQGNLRFTMHSCAQTFLSPWAGLNRDARCLVPVMVSFSSTSLSAALQLTR